MVKKLGSVNYQVSLVSDPTNTDTYHIQKLKISWWTFFIERGGIKLPIVQLLWFFKLQFLLHEYCSFRIKVRGKQSKSIFGQREAWLHFVLTSYVESGFRSYCFNQVSVFCSFCVVNIVFFLYLVVYVLFGLFNCDCVWCKCWPVCFYIEGLLLTLLYNIDHPNTYFSGTFFIAYATLVISWISATHLNIIET